MKRLIALGVAAAALLASCEDRPREVVVWMGEPVPDLRAGDSLVVLGATEAWCDDAGGTWVYEACEEVDF